MFLTEKYVDGRFVDTFIFIFIYIGSVEPAVVIFMALE